MKKEELKIKIDNCFKNSEQILIDIGELIPMLDIEFTDDKDEKSIVAVVLATGESKQVRDTFIRGLGLTFGLIKQTGKIKEVRCVAMMSEGWFSSLPKGSDISKAPLPSQDPNRREMLIATGLTADGICLMRAKEMFSVEVKGKRHFTLNDLPEMNKGFDDGKAESNVLNNFFDGYKKPAEKSQELEMFKNVFASFSLDEILEKSIKVLTQRVGGLNSEFINYKK